MCDAKLLEELKHLQVAPKKLCCTASSTCWCSKISYRFGMQTMQFEGCMSPTEMLETVGDDMTSADVQYLTRLTSYEFDPREP